MAPGKANDKGDAFEVVFVRGKQGADFMEVMDSPEEAERNRITIFPPSVTDKKNNTPRSWEMVSADLRNFYYLFKEMFLQYFTEDELKEKFPTEVAKAGMKIDKTNQEKLLASQPTVDKMFFSICNAAAKLIADEDLVNAGSLRIKFLRQSADKAFPRFTYKPSYGGWVELDSIPEEQSKVKFTAYEISQGYADATPTASDKTTKAGKANPFTNAAASTDTVPTTATKAPWT